MFVIGDEVRVLPNTRPGEAVEPDNGLLGIVPPQRSSALDRAVNLARKKHSSAKRSN